MLKRLLFMSVTGIIPFFIVGTSYFFGTRVATASCSSAQCDEVDWVRKRVEITSDDVTFYGTWVMFYSNCSADTVRSDNPLGGYNSITGWVSNANFETAFLMRDGDIP